MRAMRPCLVFALLCMACAWGGAQAVEISAGGASVNFPGPEARIEHDVVESAPRWQQAAPTPQDPQRVLEFAQLPLSFWVNGLIRMAPEAIMIKARDSDKLTTEFLAAYDAVGGADVEDMESVEINGHPGILLTIKRRDMSQTVLRPNGTPALLNNRKYMSSLMLWTGERMVMASVGGGDRLATDDAFFQSLRTATTVTPGDPDAQWERLCNMGYALLLAIPVILIFFVFVIVKTIKWRKRWRR
jgi:hypothetical protein